MKLSNRWEYKCAKAQTYGSTEKFIAPADRHLRASSKQKDSAQRRDGIGMMLSFCLLLTACSLLLVSCTPQVRHAGPDFNNLSLDDALSQYKKISTLNAVIGIEYEKNDAVMRADGSLSMSPDKLALRIYYLGFLQGEVYEENGEIKSKPKLSKNKTDILVNGLKNSIFWWNIRDYARTENEDTYELKNAVRKITIDRRTLLPVEQTITLDNGDQLIVSYGLPTPVLAADGTPAENNSPLGWYPSRLKIQLGNNVVRIVVKSYSLTK